MRADEPWPQSRPWPTTWTENTVAARGLTMEPTMDPQQAVSSLFAWGAVVTIGCAAVAAGGLLAVAKWFGGER